jgi:redox-sensing transcriptional repressor
MPERFGRRIPEPTVVRLPIYQRVLSDLSCRSVLTVSSAELADACGVNAAKVRKDLSYFGSYGTPGTGYDVGYLLGQIRRELGVDKKRPVVICGMGNLGHALVGSPGFRSAGFRIVGLFDVDPQRIGEPVSGTSIRHISELSDVCTAEQVTIAVLTTPAEVAQEVADHLVKAGVTAILNFAPAVLTLPEGVQARHVDFSAELHVLAFYQAHPETASARQNGVARRLDEAAESEAVGIPLLEDRRA